MIDCLLEYVKNVDDGTLQKLTLEDMAVCLAFHDSLAETPEKQEPYAFLPDVIDNWCRVWKEEDSQTEGLRQQPFLRQILGLALDDELERLHRSELNVLVAVHALLPALPDDAPRIVRLRELMAPCIGPLQDRRLSLAETPGLFALQEELHYATAETILSSRPRDIKVFAGIDVSFRGPLYSHTGNMKVIDHIPEDCAVTVENGSCWVNGFVLGNVAVTHHCEVHQNISGIVVARDGSIRARNILRRAIVISKRADVRCHGVDHPELVFAGNRIAIREHVNGGNIRTPVLEVEGNITGGCYTVSQLAQAHRFCCTESEQTRIILARQITSEDYGEKIDPQARRVLSKANRLRLRTNALRQMAVATIGESDRCALNALMFIIGGDQVKTKLDAVDVAERRLAFLDRIIMGLDSIAGLTEEASSNADDSPDSMGALGLEEVESEMQRLEAESGKVDEDLSQKREELRNMERSLLSDRTQIYSVRGLESVAKKHQQWVSERTELAERIESYRQELQALIGSKELLARDDRPGTKLDTLRKFKVALKKRPASDPLYRRGNSTYVNVLSRFIEKRQERLKFIGTQIQTLTQELHKIEQTLQSEFQYHEFPGPLKRDKGGIVGEFDKGVRIYTNRIFAADGGMDGALLTAETGANMAAYARGDMAIIEVPPSQVLLDSQEPG